MIVDHFHYYNFNYCSIQFVNTEPSGNMTAAVRTRSVQLSLLDDRGCVSRG